MRYLILWLSLRHLSGNRVRTLLTLLGVVVGVTIFVAGVSLSSSTNESVAVSIDTLTGRADLEVRGPAQGFSRRWLTRMRADPNVVVAAPLVNAQGILQGVDREALLIFGIDPVADPYIRSYTLEAGRFLRKKSGEVLLSAAYMHEHGYRFGQVLTFVGAEGPQSFTVVGALAGEGPARLKNGAVAVMTLDDAARLRGSEMLDSIALKLVDGQSQDAMIDLLSARLPNILTVDTPQSRGAQVELLLAMISTNMVMSSLTVIGLGSTLVFNTMAVTVTRRRMEIGILRALGVSRERIRNLFLIESACIGVLGTIPGLLIGLALTASLSVAAIIPPPDGVPMSRIVMVTPPWVLVAATISGIGIPMLAGYLPSRAAARIEPVEALSPMRAETGAMQLNRRTTLLGAVLLFGSLAMLPVLDPKNIAMITLLAWTPLMAAGMLLTPVLIGLGGLLLPIMQRRFGLEGMLAAEHLTRRPRRVSATAVVLMVSLAMGVYITGFTRGFMGFVDDWNANENAWDLTVSAVGDGGSTFAVGSGLPESLPNRVETRAAIQTIAGERRTSVTLQGIAYNLRAIELAEFTRYARFVWGRGDEQQAYARVQDRRRPAMLVSNFVAFVSGVEVGDTVMIETPRGLVAFEIAGVIIDSSSLGQGVLVMDRRVYADLWRDPQVDRLLIKLKPGGDVHAERREIERRYSTTPLAISSAADLSAALRANLEPPMATMHIFIYLIMVTAVLGIANAMVISVLERRREIATLRAIGLRRERVVRSILLEVALLVTIASAIAVPLGIYMNYAIVSAFHDFVGLRLRLDPPGMILTLILSFLTALLAAFLPALQAGRVNVLEALRDE